MAELTGEVVRQNREVPFPSEINIRTGELEEYFTSFGTGRQELFHFEKLPGVLTSVGMDQYPTWFARLTQIDPEHGERAAFIYLGENPVELIYPENPAIGTDSASTADDPVELKDLFHLARAHSHPSNTCFSPIDLRRVLYNVDPQEEDGRLVQYENFYIADIVGTPRHNFLLLRTEETELVPPEEAERIVNELQESVQSIRDRIDDTFREFVKGSGIPGEKAFAELTIDCRYQAEREIFGADYASYFGTIAATHKVAKDHKLGFYISDQDGVYRRFTDKDLEDIKERNKDEKLGQRAKEILMDKIRDSKKENL